MSKIHYSSSNANFEVYIGNIENFSKNNIPLTSEQQQRYSKYKFLQHQEFYLKRHNFYREILGEYVAEPQLIYHKSGQPYLSNHKLQFSLSHSFPYALIAISKNEQIIGADLEVIKKDIPTNLQSFLNQIELDFFATLPNSKQIEYFYKFWSSKEAILKALGTGFSFAPKNLTIEFDAKSQPQLIQLNHPNYQATDFKLHCAQNAEYIYAVAYVSEPS